MLLAQLAAFEPSNGHEAAMVLRTRQFVETHTDCFERSQQSGHVTGSAWVIDLDRKHVLLTHHLKLDKWLQPGGHADGDPDVLAVAMREAIEETGLEMIRPVSRKIFDVDVHSIPGRDGEPAHYHYDIRFVFQADRALPLRKSAESKALGWVKLTEVDRLTDEESVMRMVRKTLQFREQHD